MKAEIFTPARVKTECRSPMHSVTTVTSTMAATPPSCKSMPSVADSQESGPVYKELVESSSGMEVEATQVVPPATGQDETLVMPTPTGQDETVMPTPTGQDETVMPTPTSGQDETVMPTPTSKAADLAEPMMQTPKAKPKRNAGTGSTGKRRRLEKSPTSTHKSTKAQPNTCMYNPS